MDYAENRIRQLSRRYYNQGLDRAKVRDLSGAAEKLRICLHLDKTFTDARNLLGLIYMETGETVAALQEWIISSNLKTVGNPALEYIRRVRENQRELQNRNRSIRGYNEALRSCREGHDDIALIRLRRAVALNPKFVRAYQLMALIEMNNGKLSVARRALKKAEAVDVCNPVTRLYLQEVEAQTGAEDRKKRREEEQEESESDRVKRRNVFFRATPPYVSLMNLLIGIAVGVLAVFFLAVPAAVSRASADANRRLTDYSNTIAEQTNTISSLQSQIQESQSSADKAAQDQSSAETTTGAYEALLKAYQSYESENYTDVIDQLQNVDSSLLSTDAKNLYTTIYDASRSNAYDSYVQDGENSYYQGDYAAAAESLQKAVDIQADDFDIISLLANAYTNAGNTDKAITAWQLIVDNMPDTDYSSYASGMIQQLGGTVKESSSGQGASGTASDGTTGSTGGTAGTGTDTAGTGTDATGTGTDTADTGTDTTGTGTDTAGTGVENGYGG